MVFNNYTGLTPTTSHQSPAIFTNFDTTNYYDIEFIRVLDSKLASLQESISFYEEMREFRYGVQDAKTVIPGRGTPGSVQERFAKRELPRKEEWERGACDEWCYFQHKADCERTKSERSDEFRKDPSPDTTDDKASEEGSEGDEGGDNNDARSKDSNEVLEEVLA